MSAILRISVFILLGVSVCQCSASVIREGAGQFVFEYELAGKLRKVPVHYFAPKSLLPGSRIVFVLHGSARVGDGYRDEWKPYAEDYNFLVLCPEFSEAEFPGWWSYNGGNLYNEDKKAYTPRSEWAFNVIEGLFDFVKNDRQMIVDAYCIFGHSAGGQFVQRMVLFMPEARFSLAIANGPGSYTYPLMDKKLVDGVQFTEVTQESLRRSFQKEMILLVGSRDFVSKKMPQNPDEFDPYDRLWRARHFYKTAKTEAENLNADYKWYLRMVPDADHNSPKHAEFGSKLAAKSRKTQTEVAGASGEQAENEKESEG